MNTRHYSTEGVILKRKNFGEADRLLTLFSKHYGKVKVVAKGVRRPSSRKRGSLELFNHVKCFVARGRNLDIVTEVEIMENFSSWRKDLVKVGVAYHLAEVVERLTAEHQEHREVFELLKGAYRRLGNQGYWEHYDFINSFKLRVLQELGFLERGREHKDLDSFIEDLINGSLRTKRFLERIS